MYEWINLILPYKREDRGYDDDFDLEIDTIEENNERRNNLISLNMLKNGKASGSDGVPTNLVKEAAKFIAKPLMMIFNASLK